MTSVLDFPQLWQKPSFQSLVACLDALEIKPPSGTMPAPRTTAPPSKRLISLTGASDEEREAIWDLASKRISERSGRQAMGEITRRWPFTISTKPSFELVIKEPALTGDSIGFKTWGSSYLLALQLESLASTHLSHLLNRTLSRPKPAVLELGSGTGLLGLAAAAVWGTRVLLSDLPNIVPNLAVNADANAATLDGLGGSAEVGALTWGGTEDEVDQRLFGTPNQFKIVLVADPLYDDIHPRLLQGAIMNQLALGGDARAIVMVPKRDQTTIGLLENFKTFMIQGEGALDCLEQGEIGGQDDWEVNDDEDIKCWWGIFARR
ncbi:unnamed protein product [Parascedosporium putredinis]|uniref:Uncharacterized protein n=1 Tax=Parascedosporium putredinis TaxID=1442378 RepID=A0A9P1H904_9PEZI|nr:unnamed protein product [Parascedosporium putredinis]CAI8002583.1 unnamed protein product [Parascedosporium putredinis]